MTKIIDKSFVPDDDKSEIVEVFSISGEKGIVYVDAITRKQLESVQRLYNLTEKEAIIYIKMLKGGS